MAIPSINRPIRQLYTALELMDVSTSAYDEDKDVFASCRLERIVKTESGEVAGSALVLRSGL